LAKEFRLGKTTVGYIVHRQTWKHVN
jgi:hypothetical protein